MKTISKMAVCGLTLVALGNVAIPISNVSASEVGRVKKVDIPNSENESQLDKDVTVQNNQFVLNISQDSDISEEQVKNIQTVISETNNYIKSNNLTIDTETKTATQRVYIPTNTNGPTLRAYGKNGILAIRWNSVTIGIDKGLANDILHAGVAGGAGFIGFLVGGPYAAAAVAVAAVIVDRHLDTSSGWWFDYNFFSRTVTHYGRQ
ncbi:MAG: hypothetical protein IJG09_01075 [Methanobrevibacter sp.]|jgi:hypothetical protein|uniref:hypothetical protein n=1 Tax=Pseudolactococcus raffinolactis TaxID=1366 RepID=UPI0039AF442B|nr:hypothetical protein [Methanobrevibacter sp.]